VKLSQFRRGELRPEIVRTFVGAPIPDLLEERISCDTGFGPEGDRRYRPVLDDAARVLTQENVM
jgi:hypothetical protein